MLGLLIRKSRQSFLGGETLFYQPPPQCVSKPIL